MEVNRAKKWHTNRVAKSRTAEGFLTLSISEKDLTLIFMIMAITALYFKLTGVIKAPSGFCFCSELGDNIFSQFSLLTAIYSDLLDPVPPLL